MDTADVVMLLAVTGHVLWRLTLRATIDELLFGERPDPLDAATRVAGQIGDDPALALDAILQALVLPYASLQVEPRWPRAHPVGYRLHRRRHPQLAGGRPGSADELLRGLRADAVAAIGEVRRLVYAMRPPALDELGLVPALRHWTLQVRTADGRPLRVDVDAPDDLADLPAAVEVAAYRITVEALTNVARHSGCDRAAVVLALDARRAALLG